MGTNGTMVFGCRKVRVACGDATRHELWHGSNIQVDGKRFDEKHDNLLKEIDEIKREMHLRFDQERDDTEKIKKWVAEIKSDNKIIIDYILKGK